MSVFLAAILVLGFIVVVTALTVFLIVWFAGVQ